MWRNAMGRRSASCIIAAVVLTAPLLATAQMSTKAYRIGWLGHGSGSAANPSVADFRQGLRDLRYIEGQNLTIDYRYAEGNVDRLPDLAIELVRLPVDVIVTSGEPAALAAKRATRTIPVVVTELGLDPVKAGLVASLGRPEGNVTGLATQSEELWQKRLALLKQVVPRAQRVDVLWNPANPGNANCVEEIKTAASALGMQTSLFEVRDVGALERAFPLIAREPPDALVTCWDSVTLANAKLIADFALKHRLPSVAPLREYVEAGALISLGTSLPTQRRHAAYYVDKILKGAKPENGPRSSIS